MLMKSTVSLLSLLICSNALSSNFESYSKIEVNPKNTLYAIEDAKTELALSLFKGFPEAITMELTQSLSDKTAPSFTTPINTFLISKDNQNILIDAGGGECLGPEGNNTLNVLKEIGIESSKVNAILLTHAHTDHTCGLATLDKNNNQWQPNFPNATIFINEKEYEYWVTQGNDAQVKDILDAYLALGAYKLVKFNAGDTLLDTFKVVDAKGHTVGHSAFLWQPEDNANWMFVGDMIHNTEYQFTYPEITLSFDSNPVDAIQSRQKILEQAHANKWNIAGAHITAHGIGKVDFKDKTYQWLPN